MLEEFYFFREPRLQARLDEPEKQEFSRASSTVSSELRPNAYVSFVWRLLLKMSYLEF